MVDKLEKLQQQLEKLEKEKSSNVQEINKLIVESPEVRKYKRLNFEEKRLEREIFELKSKIDEEIKLNCCHKLVNIGNGNLCCVKCGFSTDLLTVEESSKNRKIYEQTKENSTIINTDYICDKKVVEAISRTITLKYPNISEEEFVHFFAVALHSMQTKKKSEKVKRGRTRRLFIKTSLLERSNML